MTIVNQYLHTDERDRLAHIQQINRRCIRMLQSVQTTKNPTIIITAHPSLAALKKEI